MTLDEFEARQKQGRVTGDQHSSTRPSRLWFCWYHLFDAGSRPCSLLHLKLLCQGRSGPVSAAHAAYMQFQWSGFLRQLQICAVNTWALGNIRLQFPGLSAHTHPRVHLPRWKYSKTFSLPKHPPIFHGRCLLAYAKCHTSQTSFAVHDAGTGVHKPTWMPLTLLKAWSVTAISGISAVSSCTCRREASARSHALLLRPIW